MNERLEALKNEKNVIIEQANQLQRELNDEEKEKCRLLDEEIAKLENGEANPNGFEQTSADNQVVNPDTNQVFPVEEPAPEAPMMSATKAAVEAAKAEVTSKYTIKTK